MAHDFIPRGDSEFLRWSRSFNEQINADPMQFGLTSAQAAQYASLHDAFAAAYATAVNPATNSKSNVFTKNQARRNLEQDARRLAKIIQAVGVANDAQKISLGLTVRKTDAIAVPRPTESPRVFVKLLFGSTVRVRLGTLNTSRRGKPAGIAGAMIFTYVGETPPYSLSQWRNAGNTTRTVSDITLTDVSPGDKVWITAYWYNPRAQRGPAATPVSTFIQCPTMMLGNQSFGASLRLAA